MIEQVKEKLKAELKKSLHSVISSFELNIESGTESFDEFVLQAGRYNELVRDIHHGILTNEQKNVEFAKIRRAILYIINNLSSNEINDKKPQKKSIHIEDEVYDLDKDLILIDYSSQNIINGIYDEFMNVLRKVRLSINNSSESFAKGARIINRLNKRGKVNYEVVRKVDLEVVRNLEKYNGDMKFLLPDLSRLSKMYTVDAMHFLQIPDHDLSKSELEQLLLTISSITKSTKSIRKNLNGLNLELQGVNSSIAMKKAVKIAVKTNEQFIEILREFFFYSDRFEEELELELLKKEKS